MPLGRDPTTTPKELRALRPPVRTASLSHVLPEDKTRSCGNPSSERAGLGGSAERGDRRPGGGPSLSHSCWACPRGTVQRPAGTGVLGTRQSASWPVAFSRSPAKLFLPRNYSSIVTEMQRGGLGTGQDKWGHGAGRDGLGRERTTWGVGGREATGPRGRLGDPPQKGDSAVPS